MVSAWNEKVSIPTYAIGNPEKYPMFFEKRVYQGSSGAVYPYPVIEKITDQKEDRFYNALFIENEFLKVMILPELGGRVQMVWDKIRERHVVYYNSVIKPALVGLTGPWISGGIEFNWPQHHRPGTFLPVDYKIDKNEDGSYTIWVIETERMTYQKSMAGFTLHSGKAYLEVKVRLFNGTPFPQSFLWWANPAVAVNDEYQSVFPPDVSAVYDHGKRDVSTFPVATGVYYKTDYSEGVDISRYRNIPVPTSYMAVNSKYDFVGGYEHDNQVGMIHLANHRISPGKKLWTWGNSDFGRIWNKNLTDDDGPYLELMAGVYTDNQPDFSWLRPYEEKSFSQFFIPYHQLGLIKNASKDVLLNLEISDGSAEIRIQSTSFMEGVKVVLEGKFEEICNLSPKSVLLRKVLIGPADLSSLCLRIYSKEGALLLEYTPENNQKHKVPEPAKAAGKPEQISNSEELYFTGLHLEQYRHASLDPTAYYKQALQLDANDFRNNNALGLWLLRRGKFCEAENSFNRAVASLSRFNPNPATGEAYYNLGLSLLFQYRCKEAYNAFYKATWSADIQDAAWFQSAAISSVEGRYAEALTEVEKSLSRNNRNQKAKAFRIMLLRRLGMTAQALELAQASIKSEDFDIVCYYEKYLLSGEKEIWEKLLKGEGFQMQNLEQVAYDYYACGFYSDAINILQQCLNHGHENPIIWYTIAWLLWLTGKDIGFTLEKAFNLSPDYCFPNRIESLLALEKAVQMNERDYNAHYYLGNLWYDKRQYDIAINHWEKAISLSRHFPAALRNLAVAVFNKLKQPGRALELMEAAFASDSESARLLYELDQLKKILSVSPSERLGHLKIYYPLIIQRDDLYLELITLYSLTGKYDMAADLLEKRRFHPWEGGEGKVIQQYKQCRLENVLCFIKDKQFIDAINLLNQCLVLPENLGEGKLPLPQDQEVFYLMGVCYDALGRHDEAIIYWHKATEGDHTLCEAVFYNDLQPDRIFYQAKAWQKLGEHEKAIQLFDSLTRHGMQQQLADVSIDYFAVSLPNMLIWDTDLHKSNQVNCLYLLGLGQLGSGNLTEATGILKQALEIDPGHQGVRLHLNLASIYALNTVN